MNQAVTSPVHSALHGRWQVVYQEIDGEAITPEKDSTTIEFRDNEFKIEQNQAVTYEGTFTLRPGMSGSPAEIVLIYRTSKNALFLGGPRSGVFQLEGDTLKLNFSGVGHSAPKSLNTYPDSETVLSVYRREGALRKTGLNASRLKSVALW